MELTIVCNHKTRLMTLNISGINPPYMILRIFFDVCLKCSSRCAFHSVESSCLFTNEPLAFYCNDISFYILRCTPIQTASNYVRTTIYQLDKHVTMLTTLLSIQIKLSGDIRILMLFDYQ